MTQEERLLLIVDLYVRSLYGVVYHRNDGTNIKLNAIDVKRGLLNYTDDIDERECKPYLRPMDSMTEEESEEFKAFHCVDEWHPKFYRAMCNLPNINNMINWLDKKMFDHRGLIPMGLALPAKEGMYNN